MKRIRYIVKFKLFEDLPLKLVALILAVIIWILVIGEKRSEVRLTVPLELRNLPSRLEISQQSTAQVEVAIRGFSSIVKQLTPNEIDVYIDLSNVVEGPNSFALFPDDITLPLGAKVFQISPSQIDLLLDALAEKTVPIKPMYRGTPQEGYTLDKVTTEPKVVTVVGARRLLNDLTNVETELVPIDTISQEMSRKVKLKLPSGVRVIEEEERVVTVSVTVVARMVNLVFDDVPLLVENESRQFTLSSQRITALVYGPEAELSHMKPENIRAFIVTKDLPVGQSTVQPAFDLPESITVKRYYPTIITINITP